MNFPPFLRWFCYLTSPGFWLVVIVTGIAGAVNGAYHFTKYLFQS